VRVEANQSLERIDFRVSRGGAISGQVVDEFGQPAADVSVMPFESRLSGASRAMVPAGRPATTNDLGEFRLFGLMPGRYTLAATVRNADEGLPGETQERAGYAPTVYPGTTNPRAAQRVALAPGQQISGLTMPLVAARLVRILGTVKDSYGRGLAKCSLTLVNSASRLPGDGG